MLNRIITWSLEHRFLVVTFTLVLLGSGIYSLYRLPIDAFPDIGSETGLNASMLAILAVVLLVIIIVLAKKVLFT